MIGIGPILDEIQESTKDKGYIRDVQKLQKLF